MASFLRRSSSSSSSSSAAGAAGKKKPAKADVDLHEAEPVPATRDVAVLMKERRAEIDKLKAAVDDVLKTQPTTETGEPWDGIWLKYDDIFFLRYILSFETAAKAEAHVRSCFQYRQTKEHQELSKLCFEKNEHGRPKWEDQDLVKTMQKYQVADALPKAQKRGGFTVLIRGGMNDANTMFDLLTRQEHLRANYAYREGSYIICDTVTRETGYLAKQVLVFDMKGSKLSDMMDRRMSSIHQEVSASSAYLYPQLVDKMCMVNAPKWMTYVLAFFRRIMPKRNMDKVAMFHSGDQMWKSDWAQETLDRAELPSFVGGTLSDEEVAKMPRLNGSLLAAKPDGSGGGGGGGGGAAAGGAGTGSGGLTELTVGARSKQEVVVDVPLPNASVAVTLNVAAYGVEVSAAFVPVAVEEGSGDGDGEEKESGSGTAAATAAAAASGSAFFASTSVSAALSAASAAPVELRVASKIKAEGGTVKETWQIPAGQVGQVVVEFDNSYSRLRSKTVKYLFEVVQQAEAANVEVAAE